MQGADTINGGVSRQGLIEQSGQVGNLQGRQVRSEKCCDLIKAFVNIVCGGLTIYTGATCAYNTYQNGDNIGFSLGIAFGVVGLVGFGFGVARVGEISCSVFRERNNRERLS